MLVAHYAATSAALIIEAGEGQAGRFEDGLYIHGEAADGRTEVRRYRVSLHGRRGRLVTLPGDAPTCADVGFRTLFPLRVTPAADGRASAETSSVAGGAPRRAPSTSSV